jgi:thioredoxin reductase
MTTSKAPDTWDAAIIGAGPAGASCALWLRLLGLRPILIDAAPAPGGRLNDSPYDNPWIAVAAPGATGTDLAREIGANLQTQAVAARFGAPASQVRRREGRFDVLIHGRDDRVTARHIVLATGLEPATGGLAPAAGVFFGPGRDVFAADMGGKSVAILGGGDNAFEHAGFAFKKGASRLRVFPRTIRARRDLVAAIPAGTIDQAPVQVDTRARSVNGERFDMILVMYGFQPRLPSLGNLAPRRRGEDPYLATEGATAETSESGLYAIGDCAGRAHPCVPTALADGVAAAKAIEAMSRKP